MSKKSVGISKLHQFPNSKAWDFLHKHPLHSCNLYFASFKNRAKVWILVGVGSNSNIFAVYTALDQSLEKTPPPTPIWLAPLFFMKGTHIWNGFSILYRDGGSRGQGRKTPDFDRSENGSGSTRAPHYYLTTPDFQTFPHPCQIVPVRTNDAFNVILTLNQKLSCLLGSPD